ncbi:MAG TPA: hypothetical protein VMC43_02210 [Candidatus Paceibacterota bacterium]|nr:hypothetical protein [Candidatus Paceibacterota bacterium]
MTKFRKIIHWLPRLLGIGLALFTAIFALDVFDGQKSPAEIALALSIHLIPTFLVLIATGLGWHRSWLGGFFFVCLGAAYPFYFEGRSLIANIVFIGVPMLIGFLFIMDRKPSLA